MGGIAKALALVASVSVCLAFSVSGGEPPPPGPDDGVLSPSETVAVRRLLGRLASAITKGDARALGDLLSPSVPPADRARIVSLARGEFERLSYLRFAFLLDEGQPVDRLGPDEMQVVSVPAGYEYESRARGPGQISGKGDYSFSFHLARSDGEWLIVSSDLFDIFSAPAPEQVLRYVFLIGFLGVLLAFFWLWMALDAWMRTGRAVYGLLVLVTLPVGATFYFFGVYLRRKFVRREEH
ncbi:MAG: hypothetical protein ACYTKD_08920 [Planctomycetota bacterium]